MLYVLDANVLIDANRDYYSMSRVPEFWGWLEHMGMDNQAKVPLEVYEELRTGRKNPDELEVWAKRPEVRSALLLSEEADPAVVSRVVDEGYAADLTDDEVEKLGRDPFLVAYALTDRDDRCVVTTERSKPSQSRANRHLPDVCQNLGVNCIDTFAFIRSLNFRTGWQSV